MTRLLVQEICWQCEGFVKEVARVEYTPEAVAEWRTHSFGRPVNMGSYFLMEKTADCNCLDCQRLDAEVH